MAKVLHISEFTKGGVETHLNEVLSYQSDRHELYLMASEQNTNRDSLRISADRLHLYPYKRKPLYFLKALREINKKLKELKPDIVHVHGTFAGLFLRMLLYFTRQRPVVIYCAHGWSFLMDTSPLKKRLYAWVERQLARKTDCILHISNYEYRMAMHYGLPAQKSFIVYNGVSSALPATKAVALNVDKERINLLYVGRFDRQKGFDLLLEVFQAHKFEAITLYLVGDTVLKQADYHYPENTVKIGWVHNSEIDRYMHACDAVIVPSRWEGFGIVAIEALRNKKPVIASNRGALPEIVQHGVNGYIFDFDNKQQLVSLLQSLNKDDLLAMGPSCERLFYEKFHADNMNKQIARIYEFALKQHSDSYPAAIKNYV